VTLPLPVFFKLPPYVFAAPPGSLRRTSSYSRFYTVSFWISFLFISLSLVLYRFVQQILPPSFYFVVSHVRRFDFASFFFLLTPLSGFVIPFQFFSRLPRTDYVPLIYPIVLLVRLSEFLHPDFRFLVIAPVLKPRAPPSLPP